jgi:FAD/FMN-containing dehydrogenase/Fe-S oxidoreductase
MKSLTVLREESEQARFERLRANASSAAWPSSSADELAAELRQHLKGEVRFDAGSRALYATDGSNYRQTPIGVVVPRDVDDVVAAVATARKFGAPILSRGAGTSLAGQCCNVAVVMDFSKYVNRVVRIDTMRKLAVAQPGCVLDEIRDSAKKHGLNFGPDPATHRHCTIGGMLGNNSCGSHSLLSGNNGLGLRTSDNTHELEILTYDGVRFHVGPTSEDELETIIRRGGRRGEIYQKMKALRDRYADVIRRRFPKLPRRVSGYNLDELLPENGFNVARALVGSEGTLVTLLEATLHLVPNPGYRSVIILGYPDVYSAADHVLDILPMKPTALEGIDHLLIEYIKKKGEETENLRLLPEGKGFLLVEFGGENKADADEQARQCMNKLKKKRHPPSMKFYDDKEAEKEIWEVREGGLGATAFVPGLPDMWPGWEDSAVPPERLGSYLRELRSLFDKYGYKPSVYGHFGQGCVHCRISFDLYTDAGIRKWREFLDEAADLVVRHGGSLSGEHGDGQARAELLPRMFGEELVQAFREFKQIWDPLGKMNPNKVVDPYPITSNLRIGSDYNPPEPETHFQYPDDHGKFARAALRCVGVGKCRDHHGQTMCPSYLATGEEMHSTRGRARLLWEMLNGETLTDGWRSEPVREALDLCLACKGCKSDCPVNVDMATYKAEFLAHYYEKTLRPRHAYSMGWIYWWARLAAHMPTVANFFAQTPGLRDTMKFLGGIAPQRKVPAFARETFKDWFIRRPASNLPPDAPAVLLWPDTFTNYFHPEIPRAAVGVLEAAGYEVWIPKKSLCCGRPLYDFGMLDAAKTQLREILETLRPQIQAEIPVVGLEPSCVAVFRDELVNLFPKDELAQKLSKNTFLLSEFLVKHAKDFKVPQLHRKALVHVHCHQKSLAGLDDEMELLKRLGLEVEMPEPGCCGMAGSFGFERGEHYDVSIACGERNLLPAVRKAPSEMLIIADGFSCQQQIAQCTNRQPKHLAQVLQMALRGDGAVESNGKQLASKSSIPSELSPYLFMGAGAVLAGIAVGELIKRR